MHDVKHHLPRWMLAASDIKFQQVVIDTREKFVALRDREKKLEFHQVCSFTYAMDK